MDIVLTVEVRSHAQQVGVCESGHEPPPGDSPHTKQVRLQDRDRTRIHQTAERFFKPVQPPRFEEVAVIPGNGYRMRKFRYEIVPGFQSVAILYEPLNLHGKVPAILNSNGHVGPPGKSVEYKQKRFSVRNEPARALNNGCSRSRY